MIAYRSSVSKRRDTTVWEGEYDGRKVAIKTFALERPFKREAGALAFLSRRGAPVPKLIWAGQDSGNYIIIQEWIEGRQALQVFTSASADEQLLIAQLAAGALAELSCVSRGMTQTDSSFMYYVKGGDGDYRNWPTLLAKQLNKWCSKLNAETIEHLGGHQVLEVLQTKVLQVPTFRVSLIHCDYILRNLVIGPRGITTVVDFGAAMVGDPLYDLGKIVWRDFSGVRSCLSCQFLDSWSNAAKTEVRHDLLSIYIASHCISAMAWVDKHKDISEADLAFYHLALDGFLDSRASWL